MYNIETYKTSSGREPLRDFLLELSEGGNDIELAQIKEAKKRLAKHGMTVNNYYPNLIRKVQGDIYELRPGKNRVLFFYFKSNTFVLLHGFKKKTKKTPKPQIDKALQEMQDYIRRHQHE